MSHIIAFWSYSVQNKVCSTHRSFTGALKIIMVYAEHDFRFILKVLHNLKYS